MAPTLRQLTGPGRSALRRLQQGGDCMWVLFQADGVLLPHHGSPVGSLLHPLSLSDDSILCRVVAAHAGTNPAAPATTESIRGRMGQPLPPRPSLPPSPSARGSLFQPPAHQPRVFDPAVGSDTPRGRQLVRELLDHAGRESFLAGALQNDGRPLEIREQAPTNTVPGTASSGTTPSADRDDQVVFSDRNKGLSPPFSEIVPESGPRDWFARHPGHQAAATGVLAPATVPGIGQAVLRSWSHVPLAPRRAPALEPPPMDRGTGRPGVPAVRETGFTGRLGQDVPGSRTKNAPLLPNSAGPDALAAPSPAAASPAPAASQLELLIRKWEENKAAASVDRQPASHQPDQAVPEALPSFQTPRQQARSGEEQPAEPTTGRLSTEAGFPEQNSHAPKGFFAESPSFPGAPAPRPRTDLETDRLFAETLARVLNREIRRHGLEERP
ncbi:MAG: hypothetical protein AB7E77_12040 [Desulfobulbus sp.]